LTENIQKSEDLHKVFINKLVEKKSFYYRLLHKGKPVFYEMSDVSSYYSQVLVFIELKDLVQTLSEEIQNHINECLQKYCFDNHLEWIPDFKPVE
jgi:hypothetical protein